MAYGRDHVAAHAEERYGILGEEDGLAVLRSFCGGNGVERLLEPSVA